MIRITSHAAYRISYQYGIMLRIPYTNLIRILGDDPYGDGSKLALKSEATDSFFVHLILNYSLREIHQRRIQFLCIQGDLVSSYHFWLEY